MTKTLFVTDLDGTLLSTDSKVSPRSAEIITECVRRGALFTCATARTPATVEVLLRHTLTSAPAIMMTGAATWDLRSHRFITTHLIDDDTAARCTEICRRHGLLPMIYTVTSDERLDVYVHGRPEGPSEKFIADRQHLQYKRFHMLPLTDAPDFYPRTIIIFVIGDAAVIKAAAEEMSDMEGCTAVPYPDIFNPRVAMIDIYAAGVSKAEAVMKLKKDMGADWLTVFGDNLNDIPMMRVADCAVAVENALPEVKAAAHEIIGPNTSDSVAKYILKDFDR